MRLPEVPPHIRMAVQLLTQVGAAFVEVPLTPASARPLPGRPEAANDPHVPQQPLQRA